MTRSSVRPCLIYWITFELPIRICGDARDPYLCSFIRGSGSMARDESCNAVETGQWSVWSVVSESELQFVHGVLWTACNATSLKDWIGDRWLWITGNSDPLPSRHSISLFSGRIRGLVFFVSKYSTLGCICNWQSSILPQTR